MSLEIEGKLIEKLSIQEGESKNGLWKKTEFVIETNEAYPKKICFSLWNDRVPMIDNVKEGDDIKVLFNVASRSYNGKWYTDATAYQIQSVHTHYVQSNEDGLPVENQTEISLDDEDDLPF